VSVPWAIASTKKSNACAGEFQIGVPCSFMRKMPEYIGANRDRKTTTPTIQRRENVPSSTE
jgi:hypothetical protein